MSGHDEKAYMYKYTNEYGVYQTDRVKSLFTFSLVQSVCTRLRNHPGGLERVELTIKVKQLL